MLGKVPYLGFIKFLKTGPHEFGLADPSCPMYTMNGPVFKKGVLQEEYEDQEVNVDCCPIQ